MLGLVPVFASFLALPLDVRHVTLSTGQIMAALGTLGWPALHDPAFWWSVVAIPVTGLLNVGVSFSLALRVAIRSRGVKVQDRGRLWRAMGRRLLTQPGSFLWPPSRAHRARRRFRLGHRPLISTVGRIVVQIAQVAPPGKHRPPHQKHKTPSAASASSTISHMMVLLTVEKQKALLAMIVGLATLLAGCSTHTAPGPACAHYHPRAKKRALDTPCCTTGVGPGTGHPGPATRRAKGGLWRPRSQWTPAQWSDLPGWYQDRLRDWWPAWLKGCARPMMGWAVLCQQARQIGPQADEAQVRQFVQSRLRPGA